MGPRTQRNCFLLSLLLVSCSSSTNTPNDTGTQGNADARAGGQDAVAGNPDALAQGQDAQPNPDALAPGQDALPNPDAQPGQDAVPAMDGSAGPDTGPQPSPGVCMPDPTQTGNSINVGAYCSPGGGECRQYNNVLCAIDLDPQGANFCIKIGCGNSNACAEGGCCTGRPGQIIHACIPKGCLVQNMADPCPPIDGVPDGGTGPDI